MRTISALCALLLFASSLVTADAVAATSNKKTAPSAAQQRWNACNKMIKEKYGAAYTVHRVQVLPNGKFQCWVMFG